MIDAPHRQAARQPLNRRFQAPPGSFLVGITPSAPGSYLVGQDSDSTEVVQNSFNDVTRVSGPVLLNDTGQVVLTAFTTAGSTGSNLYVLTPIPEPSTYVLILTGLCTLGFVARRRKAALGNGPHGETSPMSAVSQ